MGETPWCRAVVSSALSATFALPGVNSGVTWFSRCMLTYVLNISTRAKANPLLQGQAGGYDGETAIPDFPNCLVKYQFFFGCGGRRG